MECKKHTKNQTIRAHVRAQRDALGWSNYRLSKASGIPLSTVKDYLAGAHDTTTERADAMLAALASAAECAGVDEKKSQAQA